MDRATHTLRDGAELVIREAVAEDAATILEYIESVSSESDFLTFGSGEFEMTVEQEAAFLEAARASAHSVYLVGFVDDRLVATIFFGSRDRPRIRHAGEFGMSVRKEHWGRGIGSLMLDALIEWARGTDIVTKIDLRVRSDNARAIALYERMGFTTEGQLRNQIVIDGTFYDHVCMGLDLRA